jgi:uncharacterized membrane-anchored protein YitT (DUF2179 family)
MAGILSASFGFKGFLMKSNFIDGGASGTSLLISNLMHYPFYLLIVLINIPFVIMGYMTIGKEFAVKTAIAILGLSLCLIFIDYPTITNDKLLVAVFGGIFLGAGVGLTMRGGGVIDGTEVLAVYLSKRLGVTISDIVVIINVFVFASAAIFLSTEVALYSMITYFSTLKMLDFIIEGVDEYIGVTIISSHCEEIRKMIIDNLGRGVTVYSGKKGYGKRGEVNEVDIIYTVITRLEVNKLNNEIEKITPNAFVVMNTVKDTKGGMIKKKPFKS